MKFRMEMILIIAHIWHWGELYYSVDVIYGKLRCRDIKIY